MSIFINKNDILLFKQNVDFLHLVAGDGFEPPTSRLWAWQATRLPYPAISSPFGLEYATPSEEVGQERLFLFSGRDMVQARAKVAH